MAPTTKWTSKADNGRTFRGKPRGTEVNALQRQFKKPRNQVEEVEVETAQVVVEVVETEVQVDSVIEVAEDKLYRVLYSDGDMEDIAVTEVEEDSVIVEESVIEVEADSDGSEDNIPFSQLKEKLVAERAGVDSDEDDTQLPDTNEKQTPKLGLLGIGTEVMRQFDVGLFVGTVHSYDRKDKLYKILYSAGDMEDMDEKEYVYAYRLALANGGDANDLSSCDSADEETAYQLPKKQVTTIYLLTLTLPLLLTSARLC